MKEVSSIVSDEPSERAPTQTINGNQHFEDQPHQHSLQASCSSTTDLAEHANQDSQPELNLNNPTPIFSDTTKHSTPTTDVLAKEIHRKQMRQQRKAISDFWKENYKVDAGSKEVLPQQEVYQLYLSMNPNNHKTDFQTFHKLSSEVGIKCRKNRNYVQYHAITTSKESNAKHMCGHQTTVCFHLANIQNLITKHKNKCPIVHQLTSEDTENRIIALTETGLKKKHPDSEIMPYFKRHHKVRMDRKEKKGDAEAEEDDDHLGKSGGCFLLSSNQVPIELVEKDSNGNVEYIIAEVPSIHTAVILIYNPGSNFALDKFKEVMGPVNKYLNKNSQ